MKLSDFNFELPEGLLAEFPAENRDESRLMVLNREKHTIEHHQFKDIINFFDEGDVTLKTDSKFVPLNNPQMGNPTIFRPNENQAS